MDTEASDGLATLRAELRQLIATVYEMFELAAVAVRQPTSVQQQQLVRGHRRIVRKRAEIEVTCLALLKRKELPAEAIHQIACIIEITAELERITYLIRHMVRSPLLSHRSTSQQVAAAMEVALAVSEESVERVLSRLSTVDEREPVPLLTARGRIEAQFALVYAWMTDEGGGTAVRPYLRRQLMQLAQHNRELSNRILNLSEWITYSSSYNASDEAIAGRQDKLPIQNDKETVQ